MANIATQITEDVKIIPRTEGAIKSPVDVVYRQYRDETDLPLIMNLIDKELSEPYSIFTYRYFIHQWPQLCFLALQGDTCVGTVVCKMDNHRDVYRGYIAMLVVIKEFRGRGIATNLVTHAIDAMQDAGCDEVTLEAEVSNVGALKLYGNLGFVRAKRLHRYYLNGVDAFRLKLLFPREGDGEDLTAYMDGGHGHHHGHAHSHGGESCSHSHGTDEGGGCGHDHGAEHHHHSHGHFHPSSKMGHGDGDCGDHSHHNCGHDHAHPHSHSLLGGGVGAGHGHGLSLSGSHMHDHGHHGHSHAHHDHSQCGGHHH